MHAIRVDTFGGPEVRRLTNGRGVDVVYDSVGQSTFEESLAALRARGLLVAYGQASGAVPPFDIANLAGFNRPPGNGSLFITWSSNADYTATREELLWHTACRAGTFALNEAAAAHRLLESRNVTGKLILIP